MKSLYQHGWYVFRNLEKGFPYSANHYASNVVGLVFLGRLLKETDSGSRWYDFGLEEYFKEVRDQILPSGVHFERSTSYHRLMTELFSYTYFLLKRVNEKVPYDIEYRIKSMFRFLLYTIKPNGKSPLLGDNDDGRLLPFVKSSLLNTRYLLCIDAIAFKNPMSKSASIQFNIDAFFLLGSEALTQYSSQTASNQLLKSVSFPDAGIHVIRNESLYLCINNSGVSRYGNFRKLIVNSHTHADLLSYELAIRNTTFIVDPGTYVYTASAKERNQFRATSKHNTISVNCQDQNTLPEDNLFSMTDNVQQFDEGLEIKGDSVLFKGGYKTIKKTGVNYSHNRTFFWNPDRDECVIEDQIGGIENQKVELFNHFDFDVWVKIKDENCVIAQKEGITLFLRFESNIPFTLEVFDDTVSPSYGKKEASKTVKVSIFGEKTLNIKTTINIL
jgi:hypothetical protein